MKKRRFTIFAMLILVVTTLTFTLAGCKKFSLENSFTEEFGKREYYGLDVDKLDKITDSDSVLGAYGKLVKNFAKYDNVAYRMLTTGTAKSKYLDMDQKVYTTYIKNKNTLLNTDKIYYEDSAIGKSKVGISAGNSIVKMMYDPNAKNPYLVKYSEKEIGEDNNGYPTSADSNFVYETYENKDSFMEKYFLDLEAVSIYKIDNATIDVEKSKVSEDKNGFIEIKLVFKNETLQEATAQRRGIIALKTRYGTTFPTTASDVTFEGLSVTFKLWKSGYIRQMDVTENYKISVMGGQECSFTSTAYFSHDPEELPMSQFEFRKP